MVSNAPPLVFDRTRLRRRRDQCAGEFSRYRFLKERVRDDLLERLADTPYRFARCLDLGGHDGLMADALRQRDAEAWVVAADLSPAFSRGAGLPSLAMDEERLAFAPGSFDLVVSGLSLHWVNDLPGTLIQIRNTLRPDGLFLGALFGAGTLGELRQVLLEAESELTGGAATRIAPLPGLQDMAGLLQRAGFALPVADRETVTVRYDTMFALLADLKGMGERYVPAKPAEKGLSRRILKRAAELYSQRFSDSDGRVRATFELVWLSGWAPADNQPKPLRPGSAKTRLADALGVPEFKPGDPLPRKPR